MKVSIIVPVYNEERTVVQILRKVNSVNLSSLNLDKEVIVVDDGSTDKTVDELNRNSKLYDQFLRHEINLGKGSAIRTALKKVTGDIVLIQDADLEYNPEDYLIVLAPIIRGVSDVVYGSRFLNTKDITQRWAIPRHYVGNKILSLVTSVLYLRFLGDMETCYKGILTSIIREIPLRAKRFDFEPEITAKLLKRGHSILEVPIKYSSRSYGEGKKINFKDGLLALWYLVKYRFVD